MANFLRPEFDDLRDHDGFRSRRTRLGHRAGSRAIGLSLWELPPGEAAYPYHHHFGEEEMAIVLDGRPSLRGPDGWRELEPGDVVSFPVGERGAHQIANRGEEVVRFLAVSAQAGYADVVSYPDSGKVSAADRRPEGAGPLGRYRVADEVDYYDGETPPGR
ncbi:MAG TPA: cupin domain-containing protein [Solirubrobacteraceae bacterium]|jgi:uncharacterized cupin superfamily protein|nr:cupin domain-containing protein [Solirubrobacteraceae bacterium]